MRKFLSCKKTAIVLIVVTIVSIGFYVYMFTRPISYGMGYHTEVEYEGGTFKGTMKFYSDRTMVIKNTTFDEEIKSRYYYKDGYVFYTTAETEEEYEKEVATINENFEEAINRLFYADKINAFRLLAEEADGYSDAYTCAPAIVFAVAGGVVELMLIGLGCYTYKRAFRVAKETEMNS